MLRWFKAQDPPITLPNWLFSYRPVGAEASSRLYGLVETSKANGLEPYTNLSCSHIKQAIKQSYPKKEVVILDRAVYLVLHAYQTTMYLLRYLLSGDNVNTRE